MDDAPPFPDVSADEEGEIMAAIDDVGNGSRLVIADVSREEMWLSASTETAVSVAKSR